ncbi:hypothetical protein WANG_p1173 (plasmid) [Lactobacillus kefiranofaciens subsp. kefiranofaciens]|nr:hypothetical protein WANG_p1173 [Lactobacillus kefiranofaciens subsp. kefiranofaciens]
MKPIRIKTEVYCISTFAKHYGFAYSTVRSYYQKGYRDEHLLRALQKNPRLNTKTVKINGKYFKNRLAAANFYHIPPATFYRYERWGQLKKLIRKYSSFQKSKQSK